MTNISFNEEVSDHHEELLHSVMFLIRKEQHKLNVFNSISNVTRSKFALGKQLCYVKGMRVIEFEIHKKIKEISEEIDNKKFRKKSSLVLKSIREYHGQTIKKKDSKWV